LPRDLLPIVRSALGDRYTIETEIGRGAAAIVFRAKTSVGQDVALKILRPELVVTVTAERFLREIQIVSRLSHPRIGRLIDSGERDWLIYFVMQYIEGPSLQQVLRKYHKLTISDTVRVAGDLLEALAYAHGQGIVHRDVKPDNVVISREGAMLLDFGIARAVALSGTDRLTRSGIAVGTAYYMSPEQITAGDLDGRSDLYSVGCVLYECLAGRTPYHHANETRVLEQHQHAPVPSLLTVAPHVPEALARLVDRALAKNREERWPTAAAMLQALSVGRAS